MPAKYPPFEQRFWAKVDFKLTGCWEWRGYRMKSGYGKVGVWKQNWLAHRMAYEMYGPGPIPKGLEIDHLCRNRACVNPLHLEAVPHRVNQRRMSEAKTHCPQGHAYDEANTYMHRGGRHCRTCMLARSKRQWQEGKRAPAAP